MRRWRNNNLTPFAGPKSRLRCQKKNSCACFQHHQRCQKIQDEDSASPTTHAMAGAIRPHGGPVEAGVHPSDAEERSMVHARLQRGQDPPDAVVMRIRQTQLQSGPISNHPFFIPNISQSIYTTSTSTCQLFKHATSEPLKCTAVVMVNACYHDYTKDNFDVSSRSRKM